MSELIGNSLFVHIIKHFLKRLWDTCLQSLFLWCNVLCVILFPFVYLNLQTK